MAISYIGGKSRISSFIIPHIPKDIETYVEPFSGMFWVLLKMDLSKYPNLKTIVYNDINKLNVNFFRSLKDPKKLWELSRNIPIEDTETYNEYKSILFSDDDFTINDEVNYDIAIKYAYVLSQLWSGTNPRKGKLIKNGGYTGKDGIYKSKFEIFRQKLIDEKFQFQLSKITFVENMDFVDIIEKYDSKSTFFYLDPPYYKTEDYYINHDFDINTHNKLADTLKSIKGRFALSYYYFDQLSEWFPSDKYSWTSKIYAKSAMSVKDNGVKNKAEELLIMNYNK